VEEVLLRDVLNACWATEISCYALRERAKNQKKIEIIFLAVTLKLFKTYIHTDEERGSPLDFDFHAEKL
jgi:hypothetical protein